MLHSFILKVFSVVRTSVENIKKDRPFITRLPCMGYAIASLANPHVGSRNSELLRAFWHSASPQLHYYLFRQNLISNVEINVPLWERSREYRRTGARLRGGRSRFPLVKAPCHFERSPILQSSNP